MQHVNTPLFAHSRNEYPSSSNVRSSGVFWDCRRANPQLDLDNNINPPIGRRLIKDFDDIASNNLYPYWSGRRYMGR